MQATPKIGLTNAVLCDILYKLFYLIFKKSFIFVFIHILVKFDY